MSPTQFKLSKPPDGFVRRVNFPDKPSWSALAAKIETLYNIPQESIGVSYLDIDGDEVTLSSDEELQDYYQSLGMQDDGTPILVRFTVRDLDSFPNDKPLPETPRTASAMNYRNTFGRSAPVLFQMEVEDGWQPIPTGLADMFAPGQPHAFVEVLDSDADVSQFNQKRGQDGSRASSTADSTDTLPEIIPTPTLDKGKARARSETPETISSTQSVVAAEGGAKHPIHVMAMKNASTDAVFRRRGSRSRTSTALGPRTPTPRSRTPILTTDKPSSQAQDDDPPLPNLDDMSAPPSNIANDVADLFATLSSILASHPELSEGIRNIVRNASNGTYWQTHRDQVTRAAEEIRRSAIVGADEIRQVAADGRRSAEDVAGRRVADALSNVIRVIVDITGSQVAGPHAHTSAGAEPATSTPLRRETGRAWHDQGTGFRGPPLARGGHGRHGPPSWGFFGPRWGENGPFPTPPQPPFGHFHPPPGPPPVHPPPPVPHGPFGRPHPGHHPHSPAGPPPPHRGPFGAPPPFGPLHPHGHHAHGHPGEWGLDDPFTMPGGSPGWHHHHHHDASWGDTVPGLPPPHPNTSEDAEVTMFGATTLESPDAAKKSLQAAKDAYIAEKEKYRRLREERKKRRMNLSTDSEMKDLHDSPVSPRDAQEPVVRPVGEPPALQEPSPDPPQIISNARGPFPQLELYSVPHRSHTIHGTGHRRDASWGTFGSGRSTQAGRAAAADSIVRRLGDMGFTSAQYPVLTSKVAALVPRHGEVSKAREDSIVTEIVEELVQEPPLREIPQASGSGNRAH